MRRAHVFAAVLFSFLFAQTSAPAQSADAALSQDYAKAMQLLDFWEGSRSDLEEAQKLLFSIVARDRDYAPAYVGLSRLERKSAFVVGSTYHPDGLTRSRKFADHALKLDPNLYDAHVALAWTAIAQGDFDAARTSLDRAEEIRKGSSATTVARAQLADDENDASEALRFARQVINASDARLVDRGIAYQVLEHVYEARGDMDDADAAYQAQVKIRPDSAWAHGNYALFLLQRGKTDAAIANAERAVTIMRYPIGVSTLARAYVAKAGELWDAHQYDAAAAYVDKAVRLGGGDAEMYYVLGVYYERAAKRTGNQDLTARAADAYRKSLELNPNHKAARQALARLQH